MGFSFRDFLSLPPGGGGIAPPWLTSAGAATDGTGGRLMYALGLGLDALAQKVNEGMRAHMPGYGTDTALPYLSLDRRISQGPSEPAAAFVPRLQAWLDSWAIAGSGRSIMQQLRGYLSPVLAEMRTVDRSSNWQGYIPSSNPITDAPEVNHAANWAWDTTPNLGAEYTSGWHHFWLIVFSAGSNVWCSPGPTWGTPGLKWGDTDRSWGFDKPASLFAGLRQIVKDTSGGQWKPAHGWCRWIIVSFVDTQFNPVDAAGVNGMPNGDWGTWGKTVVTTRVASRSANARYVDGVL